MKRIVLLLLMVLSGCIVTDVIYGDSEITTINTIIPEFNGELCVDFPIRVTIDSGAAQVSITTDKNLQRYYSVDTTNGKISIHRSTKYKLISTEERVEITLPHLKKISLTNATIIDTVHDSIQHIQLDGSAHLTTEVYRKDLHIYTGGTAKLAVSGDVRSINIIHKGSETLDFSKIYALNGSIENFGTGSLICAIESEVRGALRGSGNLILTTSPPIIDVDVFSTGALLYRTDSLAIQ